MHPIFNRQLFTWGGLFDGELFDFVPSVGILIVQKLQEVLIILTSLDIEFLISSSTLPPSVVLEKYQSTVFFLEEVLKKIINYFLCVRILIGPKCQRCFFTDLDSQTCCFSLKLEAWIPSKFQSTVSTWGELLSRKILDPDPCVGILTVQGAKEWYFFSVRPGIQFRISC